MRLQSLRRRPRVSVSRLLGRRPHRGVGNLDARQHRGRRPGVSPPQSRRCRSKRSAAWRAGAPWYSVDVSAPRPVVQRAAIEVPPAPAELRETFAKVIPARRADEAWVGPDARSGLRSVCTGCSMVGRARRCGRPAAFAFPIPSSNEFHAAVEAAPALIQLDPQWVRRDNSCFAMCRAAVQGDQYLGGPQRDASRCASISTHGCIPLLTPWPDSHETRSNTSAAWKRAAAAARWSGLVRTSCRAAPALQRINN